MRGQNSQEDQPLLRDKKEAKLFFRQQWPNPFTDFTPIKEEGLSDFPRPKENAKDNEERNSIKY